MNDFSKQDIVRQLDELEAELFGLTNKIKRLRLDLQRQWRVLPYQGRPREIDAQETIARAEGRQP